MRVSSVVGFIPSRTAAPPAPRMRHAELSSTARMCSRSTSISLGLRAAAADVDSGSSDRQPRPVRDDHRALDDVAQLADVARPGVALQRRQRLAVDRLRCACRTPARTPRPTATPAAECPRRARAAAAPGSGTRSAGSTGPRGTRPRRSRCSRLRWVAAMIRVSTEIGRGLPSRSNLPLLEHAQQLDLHVERQVADLVEEDRRVVGELEPADLPRQRAGERALLAAEQLAFDQRRRNRRAVDPHHRRVPRRGPSAWMCVANSSLPVPVSPSSSTVESVAATCSICASTWRSAATLADDLGRAEPLPRFVPQVDVLHLELVLQPLRLFDRRLQRLVALLPAHHLREHAGDHRPGGAPAPAARSRRAATAPNLTSAVTRAIDRQRQRPATTACRVPRSCGGRSRREPRRGARSDTTSPDSSCARGSRETVRACGVSPSRGGTPSAVQVDRRPQHAARRRSAMNVPRSSPSSSQA